MQIKISFDTETESIEEIKRLVVSLQDLVAKREKSSSLGNPLSAQSIVKPSQVKVEVSQPQVTPQSPVGGRTSGGGRVIPYEDMSETLSKIVSGRKY